MSKIYAKIGKNAKIGEFVLIGKKGMERKTVIGNNVVIRSHTVIYPGNKIRDNFKTGHHVMIREGNVIGNNVSIGTGTVVERDSIIEDNVRIHSKAFIPEYTTIKEGAWVGPNVTFTNAVYPLSPKAKETMEGALVEKNAKIGGGAVILPYVIIGENALVGAGSVVTHDVPKDTIVIGNPARVLKKIGREVYGPLEKQERKIPRALPSVSSAERKAIMRVMATRQFIKGNEVPSFEKEFASYTGTKYAVAVNSGTSALIIALMANGVRGEVITASNSYMATGNAIFMAGAKPVFVDIDPETYNMDPSKLEDAITERTSAIMPVHLFGQPADMDEIMKVARKNKLIVIEDACQAHGAEYKGKRAGSIGDAGCFSFFPTKNMTVFGDGGMITTNDRNVMKKATMLRDAGRWKSKDDCLIFGMNNRMSEISAAVGREQLKQLEGWIKRRRKIASIYKRALKGINQLHLPREARGTRHVFHLYTMRSKRRAALKEFLGKNGIGTSVMYPIPIHMLTAYRKAGYKQGNLPITEKYASEILSIPIYPECTDDEVEFVCSKIRGFYKL